MFTTLPALGLIQISGVDAQKLLAGQLTTNLQTITPQNGVLSAQCNPQGRIISLFYLSHWQDAYYLVMPRAMIAITQHALKKYAVFYKVTLSTIDAWQCIGFTNPLLREKLISKQLPIITLPVSPARYLCFMTEEIWQSLQKEISSEALGDARQWKAMDMHDQLPCLYPETSEKFLPHELNLHLLQVIDFNKGCFTGQEIIARMHYRAKLKNHLYHARLTQATVPLPGEAIYFSDNQIAGTVVDVYEESAKHYQILMIGEINHIKNEHLFLNTANKSFLTFAKVNLS